MQDTHEDPGVRMTNKHDLISEESSSVPLRPSTAVNGEDAAVHDRLAGRDMALMLASVIKEVWRRHAERLPAESRDAELTDVPPAEGEFASVPDGEPAAAARGEPA
jgi:hypothetical protein